MRAKSSKICKAATEDCEEEECANDRKTEVCERRMRRQKHLSFEIEPLLSHRLSFISFCFYSFFSTVMGKERARDECQDSRDP